MNRLQWVAGLALVGSLALASGGCGGENGNAEDIAVNADLAIDGAIPPDMVSLDKGPGADGPDMTPVDMAKPDLAEIQDLTAEQDFLPPPDFAVLPDLVPPPDLGGADLSYETHVFQYVINSMAVPQQQTDYAYDLNGDAKADNGLAGIVQACLSYSIDMQMFVGDSVTLGESIELMELTTHDVMRVNDREPKLMVRAGISKPMPDFSGMGMFGIDNNQPPSTFVSGFLGMNAYTSFGSALGAMPVDVKLFFYFFGNVPLALNLHGAHVEFTTGTDLKSGAPGLTKGAIHGSITTADMDRLLVPAIAFALSEQIRNNGPSANLITNQVDVGGCFSNGHQAVAMDKQIDDCEVKLSMAFLPVLAPDVALYDNLGNYKPDPNNANKDSLSIGVGFTAVQATF